MPEEKTNNNSSPALVKIIVKTKSEQIKEEDNYYINLDQSKPLNECRPFITQELDLQVPWIFLSNEAALTKSAEQQQSVEELLKDNEQLILRRELSKKEKQKAEADTYTKEEEDKHKADDTARREHMKNTTAALTTLQDTMKMDEDDLIDKDALKLTFNKLSDAALKSVGVGGDTKDQLRKKTVSEVTSLVKSLGLPRTAGRAPGNGGFQALSFVARVKSDDNGSAHTNIASKYTVAVNEIDTRIETFQEEWEKKACESGFSQMSAEISAAYGKGPVKVAASANFSQRNSSSGNSGSTSQNIYLVGIQDVKKARITIPPTEIMLNESVEEQFKNAVKDYDDNKSVADNKSHVDALLFLLNRYGYFTITEYTLGGSLHTSETQTKEGSSSASKETFKRKMGLALDGSMGLVSGSAAVAQSKENKSESSENQSKQASQFQLSAKGGNVTDKNDPTKWTESLSIDNWEIISFGRLIPIYEFISDNETREKCKKALAVVEQEEKKALENLVVFNSFAASERINAQSIEPIDKSVKGRKFKESGHVADVSWVELGTDAKGDPRYFKGIKLICQNGILKLGINVVDQTMQNDEWIETPQGSVEQDSREENKLGEHYLYLDTTPIYIPKGYRITALRLTGEGVANSENRLGLEVKTENAKGSPKYLRNETNNEEYIDSNTASNNVSPCLSPTVISDGKCVMGIHLKDLGDNHTTGIVVIER